MEWEQMIDAQERANILACYVAAIGAGFSKAQANSCDGGHLGCKWCPSKGSVIPAMSYPTRILIEELVQRDELRAEMQRVVREAEDDAEALIEHWFVNRPRLSDPWFALLEWAARQIDWILVTQWLKGESR